MIYPRIRQRRIGRRHVQHARLVLPQHDAVVRRSAPAVLGQRVLHTRETLGDTGVVRGVGNVLRTVLQLQHQPVVTRVQGPLQRLGDVARPAAAALDVGDLDAVELHRRTVDLVPEAHPLLQRGHQREHLERGTRRQTGLREVESLRVGAAEVGLDATRPRVDAHHRRPHVGVLAVERVRRRALRRPLRLGVDRRRDLQPLGVQLLLVDVEDVLQLLKHLALDEPVGSRRPVLLAGLVRRHRHREHLRRPLLRRQRADGDHAVEHPVPALARTLGIDGRVERRRPLNQRTEQRALGDVELFDGLVEVGVGGRRDAVGPAAEVDDVQVRLHHRVLGPLVGHLRGDDQLLGLADQAADAGAGVPDQRVLDVLLGDRRAALEVAAEDVVLERAEETPEGEARIRVEVAVLRRHRGVAHVLGDLVDRNVDAVAFGRDDLRDLAAVTGEDHRHLRRADVLGLRHVDDEVGHREGDDRQHDRRGDQRVADAAQDPPVDRARPLRRHGSVGAVPSARRRSHGRPRWRSAVECGLDDLDGVSPRPTGGTGRHRRQDHRPAVVGGPRRDRRVVSRLLPWNIAC